MTAQTVQKTLHNVNLYGQRPRKKTLLALRAKNFAQKHQKKPDEYWEHILWSDEVKRNVCGRLRFVQPGLPQ